MRRALAALLIPLAAPVAASDFVLGLPIDCTPGTDCFIQQFVDRDPGPGALDFACGGLSYDGHKGTDFGLPTHTDRLDGVDVLAAAPGIVAALRDGMPDTGYSPENAAAIEGRDCGNGVVIRHADGWETQYCHLARGSLAVTEGQQVETGTVLGRVGFSGRTQFPHLHLSLRRDGAVVDPFAAGSAEGCADGPSLWAQALPYRPGGLLAVGFADTVPAYDAIKAGTASRDDLTGAAPALVLFGLAFGGRAGDVVTLDLTGPDGDVIAHRTTLDKAQAQFFRAAGKRLTAARWPAGAYTGTVTLWRGGERLDRMQATLAID